MNRMMGYPQVTFHVQFFQAYQVSHIATET